MVPIKTVLAPLSVYLLTVASFSRPRGSHRRDDRPVFNRRSEEKRWGMYGSLTPFEHRAVESLGQAALAAFIRSSSGILPSFGDDLDSRGEDSSQLG